MGVVNVKTYAPMPIDVKEVRRYAGCAVSDASHDQLINDCIREVNGHLSFKACYATFPIEICIDSIDLGFQSVRSADLAKCLKGCSQIIVFASTVGIGADRLIKKYSAVSPAKALIMNALCTERIESLCDLFCKELSDEFSKKSKRLTPRFSPGYGDLPLNLQTDIIRITEAQKSIGLSLTDNLIMIPTKSVTAIIGVKSL